MPECRMWQTTAHDRVHHTGEQHMVNTARTGCVGQRLAAQQYMYSTAQLPHITAQRICTTLRGHSTARNVSAHTQCSIMAAVEPHSSCSILAAAMAMHWPRTRTLRVLCSPQLLMQQQQLYVFPLQSISPASSLIPWHHHHTSFLPGCSAAAPAVMLPCCNAPAH